MHMSLLCRVHVWNEFFRMDKASFRFKLNFQFPKIGLRFQINSNGFSRDRSFGQESNFSAQNYRMVGKKNKMIHFMQNLANDYYSH